MHRLAAAGVAGLLLGTAAFAAPPTGKRAPDDPKTPPKESAVTVESVAARVNNAIITSVDVEHAEKQLVADLQNQTPPPAPQEAAQAKKDLLRDLINQQLLLQRASDLGYSAETETIRRLDEIRRSMNLGSMEELQKAVEAQGEDYEEFKRQIKNGILQQMVIEQDVAPRITLAPEDVKKYYDQHKSQFVGQAGVDLSEILISTKDQPASALPRLKDLADQVRARAARGEAFAKLASRYSQGTTAANGGEIGFFKQSSLSPELQKALAKTPVGSVTPVLAAASGYLIYRVNAIQHAGQESFDEARNQVQQLLYEQKLQPELRDYLNHLRSQAYIKVASGYVDTGASASTGVNLERFERVLPQDLPKPTEKPSSSGGLSGAAGPGL